MRWSFARLLFVLFVLMFLPLNALAHKPVLFRKLKEKDQLWSPCEVTYRSRVQSERRQLALSQWHQLFAANRGLIDQ